MAYKLYHENQEAALCGVHCLNTLLQGPYISEWDLAKIAHEFDALEARLMGQQGLDTPDYLKFAAEGSGNVARDGMFSIQVLQKALSNWDLTTTPLTHPNMQRFSMDPTKAAGYICNLSEHWLTIRPVHGQWWNLNSLLPAPQMVGLVYLHTYLETLRRENWTIYVVQGTVPIQADPTASYTNIGARLWTPEEAKLAHESSTVAKKRAKGMGIMEDLLQTAKAAGGALTLGGRSTNNSVGTRLGSPTVPSSGLHDLTEDEQLAVAVKESMEGRVGPSGAVQSQGFPVGHESSMGSLGVDEDPELASAIAASLASFQGGGNGAGPSNAHAAGTDRATQGPSSSAIPQGTSSTQSKLGLISHPVECAASDGGAAGQAGIGAPPAAPDDDEAPVDLVVKLPDNKRVKAVFRRADRVSSVMSWLHEQGWDMKKHRLCRSYPKATLEEALRLQDAGVQAREMLIVERNP